MKFVENILEKGSVYFEKGRKLHKFYYLWEAADTFFMTPGKATKGSVHVRDGLDLKRMMTFVMISLLPCIMFGLYNVGYQANLVLSANNIQMIPGIRGELLSLFGITADSSNILFCFLHGATYFIPIYAVTMMVGIFWEVLFSTIRKEEVNEGFFVTAPLFALIVPPTIPLWQVTLGISFGVIIAKEIFGGTGMNFLNPALAARAFLFFAYPAEISGDLVWVAVDGHTGATALSQFKATGASVYTLMDGLIGRIPGSIGETSALACIMGGIFLIITRIGSYRIILSCIFGAVATSLLFNFIGSTTNPMFNIPAHYHLVYGGFMFGCMFMATDPVTGAQTLIGQYFYGLLIGVMVILIRVVNPAYPEGMMLAILFGNIFAPLIDYFVIAANIKRRRQRCQTTA
jgi:Na+-transporting NADH:ubiquinone oxidoreductase subunit B